VRSSIILAAAAATLLPFAAQAQTVTEGIGDDAAELQSTVDSFRSKLGDLNAPVPQNLDGGRREINWDAAPDAVSDPNPFPGDFFNADFGPRARGIEFTPTGDTTGFLLSSTEASGQPVAFGFGDFFPRFSEERLFSPVGGTTFDITFYNPAKPNQRATTSGFGAVFTGVTFDDTASLSYFDIDGNLLAKEFASASNNGRGLSFLGVSFSTALIAKVIVEGGDRFLSSNGDFDGPAGDAFVFDDFIFGEPIPVGEVPIPGALPLMAAGLGLMGLRRKKKRA